MNARCSNARMTIRLLLAAAALLAAMLLAACAEDGTIGGNSGGGGGAVPLPASVAATFTSDGCDSAGCHGGAIDPHVQDCNAIRNVPGTRNSGMNYITPNDTANSLIFQVAAGNPVTPAVPFPMTMSAGNVATLNDWINGGATCP